VRFRMGMELVSIRTVVFLILGIINALWLAGIFVVLFFYGEGLVSEPNKVVAGIEVGGTVAIVVLGIERLFHLRERR
jgi:hypothetical protein